jgi:hypothetical protein
MPSPIRNVQATQEGDTLVLRLPMNATPTPSATGKTLVVASSRGAQETELLVNGQPVHVNVNAYVYPARA